MYWHFTKIIEKFRQHRKLTSFCDCKDERDNANLLTYLNNKIYQSKINSNKKGQEEIKDGWLNTEIWKRMALAQLYFNL
jgi:site-specific DNA-adenine methylase